VPADPTRQGWRAAQALIGGIETGVSALWGYARNALGANRPLPEPNPQRPNLIAAITLLRKGLFLGASVVDEVAIELEKIYPHLKLAVEGAKTETPLSLPYLEGNKTLYAIPLVLTGPIEHMVTFVVDTDKNQVEYFDPKGRSILDSEGARLNKLDHPEIIDVYFAILEKYGNFETRVLENRLPHQRDVNNCGAFVLRYIENRAKGMTAEVLQKEYSRQSISTFRDQLDEMLCNVTSQALGIECDDCDFPEDFETPPLPESSPLDAEALREALEEFNP